MAKREITVREREVLMLVSAGVSSREIAARLAISPATVESHVRSAMCKVGARSRIHAVLLLAGPDARTPPSSSSPSTAACWSCSRPA